MWKQVYVEAGLCGSRSMWKQVYVEAGLCSCYSKVAKSKVYNANPWNMKKKCFYITCECGINEGKGMMEEGQATKLRLASYIYTV